jgi:hypothetical protein
MGTTDAQRVVAVRMVIPHSDSSALVNLAHVFWSASIVLKHHFMQCVCRLT